MAKYKFTAPELRLRAPNPGASESQLDKILVSPAQKPPVTDYDLENNNILIARWVGQGRGYNGWLAEVCVMPMLATQEVNVSQPGDYSAHYCNSSEPPFNQTSPRSNTVTVKSHTPIPD
jgi:hypothetical protein